MRINRDLVAAIYEAKLNRAVALRKVKCNGRLRISESSTQRERKWLRDCKGKVTLVGGKRCCDSGKGVHCI